MSTPSPTTVSGGTERIVAISVLLLRRWTTPGLGRAGGPQPVGVGAGLDDERPKREAIDNGCRQAWIDEGLPPLRERGVAGHGHRRPLLSFGQYLEQQLGAAGVEMDVAELIEAQKLVSSVAGDHP